MRCLGAEKAIYKFSGKNKAAYKVSDGERVVVETKDAFSNMIRSSKTLFEDLSMDDVNPATGPIEIKGLLAGETLCVSIEKIKCGSTGVVMCSPELGVLMNDVRRSRTKIVPVRKNKAMFSEGLEVELNPHVGVIGVSPSSGEFPTFYPGDFGGNLDTVEAGEGSRVHLPTFVDGGMVAMGDVHASMGDGEVCGTGIEVPAEITVAFSKNPELQLKRPMIETPTSWISYAAAKTLDGAAKTATSDMVRFIMNSRGVDFEEAYMLASVAANLRISQVVDPLMAAKMEISKRYL
ncbi:MAG TPA: acetamidase/formamidase family protein [Thermoplasmata archaeon]|nr:acetamidase/formamidase family protein [Thermoplasmata archaeon]